MGILSGVDLEAAQLYIKQTYSIKINSETNLNDLLKFAASKAVSKGYLTLSENNTNAYQMGRRGIIFLQKKSDVPKKPTNPKVLQVHTVF